MTRFDRQVAGNAPRTDLDWLSGRFDALYLSDARGRLVARKSASEGPPPRFVFGRTRLGCSWRFRADVPDDVVRELARFAALEGPAHGPLAERSPPPERLEPMRRSLEASGVVERTWSGLAYRFDLDGAAGGALEACAESSMVVDDPDDPLLSACAEAFGLEEAALVAGLPVSVSTHAGRVVSLCRCVHGDPSGFVHARVDTLEYARGRGHGPRVVAAWALAVAARGGRPLYATSWSNRASRAVARRLGLVAFADAWSFT